MAEILTRIWSNIDKFNYKDVNTVKISQEDINIFKKSQKNLIMKPALFFFITFVFSRNRLRIWNSIKKYFMGYRLELNKKLRNIEKLENISENEKTIKFEYKNQEIPETEYYRVPIITSRIVRTKGGKNEKKEETILIKNTKSFSDDHMISSSVYKEKANKLSEIKNYLPDYLKQKKSIVKLEHFLLNTKLVYLPFIFILLYFIYDFSLTNLALYLKLQPIADEYYNQKINKKK